MTSKRYLPSLSAPPRRGTVRCGIARSAAGSAEAEKTWNFQGTRKPDEELKVTRVTRLTHPQVHADQVNFWYSAHYAYNSDGTRIMYFEAPKSEGIRKAGIVWARISDLKKWTTLKGYLEIAIHPAPSSRARTMVGDFSDFSEWSPFKGEESIIYARDPKRRMIVRYDTDSDTASDVISYDSPEHAAFFKDSAPSRIVGWTTDSTLIVNIQNQGWQGGGCFEIDVRKKTRKYWPNANPLSIADENFLRWPYKGHGHGGISPDRKYAIALVGEVVINNLRDWVIHPDGDHGGSEPQGHAVSRQLLQPASGDGPRVVDGFQQLVGGGRLGPASKPGPRPKEPFLDNYGINQMWRDGTAKLLYRLDSAGYSWGGRAENWGVMPFTNLRKDGKVICFTSTSGTYSRQDFQTNNSKKPYGDVGVFVAEVDLAKNQADPNDDIVPPTMPTDLKAVSSDDTVTLTWGPSVDLAKDASPSTGIAGYNIFRDDVKIDVVVGEATRYVDRFNLKSGKSYRYFISAYDQMALESPRTAEVSVAVGADTKALPPAQSAGPIRVHPTNPRWFTDGTKSADGSPKAIYLGGHQIFVDVQDNSFNKEWTKDMSRPKTRREGPGLGLGRSMWTSRHEQRLNYLRGWIIWSTGSGTAAPPRRIAGPDAVPADRARNCRRRETEVRPPPVRRGVLPAVARPRPRPRRARDLPLRDALRALRLPGRRGGGRPAALGGKPVVRDEQHQGLDVDRNRNRLGEEFFSLENPEVVKIQKAYIEKMVDALNDLDNIFWEICNEASLGVDRVAVRNAPASESLQTRIKIVRAVTCNASDIPFASDSGPSAAAFAASRCRFSTDSRSS